MRKLKFLLFTVGLLTVLSFKGINTQSPNMVNVSDVIHTEQKYQSTIRSLDLLVIPGPNTDMAQVRFDFMARLLSDFNGWQTCNWKGDYAENWSINWMSSLDLQQIASSLGYSFQIIDTEIITSTDDTQPNSGGIADGDIRIIYDYNCDMN